MRKIFNKKFKVIILCLLCVAILIIAPAMAVTKSSASANKKMYVLNLWQIDSFEGGKGSRATYLQNTANEFSKKGNAYITVTSVTSAAAQENLKNGNIPDLISYGAGCFGLEEYIKGTKPFTCWCYGGYCILSLDENSDFTDVTYENTIINEGTENNMKVTALMCGLESATYSKPTGAYVSLINGKYKYLLGTQRDIFRLKTRGVSFSVKPVTQFNDLYQNISVTAKNAEFIKKSEEFIEFLLSKSKNIEKLGLMSGGYKLYTDEMGGMEGLTYEYKLISPISPATKAEIDGAVANNNLKKLKTLFN